MKNGNVKFKIIFLLVIFLGIFVLTENSKAATYYVGSNEIYKTIPAGLAAISPGDTLIIRDGTYSENIYTDQIPDGTSWNAGEYITVKAENDGGAIIAGSFFSYEEDPEPKVGYYVWEGLEFVSASSKGDYRNHVKFLRCGFINGQVCGPCDACCSGAFILGTGSDKLFEDCWFAGAGGRYKIAVYDSSNVVLRRCVVRNDGGYTNDNSNPEAVIAIYNSDNVALQNVITIDNDGSYSTYYQSSIYATGHQTLYHPVPHSHPSNNVSIAGWIDLNGQNSAFYVDTDDGSNGMSISNSVIYGNDTGINDGNTGTALAISNLSMGEIGNSSYGLFQIWDGSADVANSNFWNFIDTDNPPTTNTCCNTYNPNVWSGVGIMHVNPLTEANGQMYLPRIEDGSILKTGCNGQQVGAQITKRIGVSGTMYGENGWNAVTSDDLWPWPNENRIKDDFSSVSVNGDRGFAVSGNGFYGGPVTLTSYIWEYLGNPCPQDVCDYGNGGEIFPSVPSGLSVS